MSTRPASRLAALSVACLALIALLVPHAADARSKPRQTGALVTAPAKTASTSTAGRAFAAAQRAAKARKNGRGKRGRKARKPKTSVPASSTTAIRSDLLFGAHVDGDVYGGNLAKTDALERQLGRRVQISQWYQSWGGNDWVRKVQPQLIKAVTDSGRTPMLTWEPWNAEQYGSAQPEFSLEAIAAGRYDDYITEWAIGLRDTGTTVYLRMMHEMNGGWYPWGTGVNGNTPAQYRAAWRHVVEVFRANGATNVKFVWCPLVDNVPNTPGNQMERYYPGTDVVDVLSLDGYNWGTNQPGNGGWRSFEQVFGKAYQTLTKLGPQPIWIAEVGSAPEGGDKAQWVRDMFKTANGWDRLKAIVWFDVDKEEDWRAAPVADAFRP